MLKALLGLYSTVGMRDVLQGLETCPRIERDWGAIERDWARLGASPSPYILL